MTSSSDDPKHDPRHDPAVSAGAPNFRTGGGDAEAPGAGAGAVGAGAVGAGAAEAGPVEPPVIDATASGTVPPEAADDATGTAAGRDAELEAQLAEMREKWVRTEAELQNVRNRARREVEDARQYAVQKFARDVVEAAENLRRGLGSLPAGDGADGMVAKLREGFESVERSFLGILERNGIKATDPTGAVFDANLHQAMAEQPTADHPPGTVIQSWTSSWTLNGRLLKPAMVVVAKAPAEPAVPAGADNGAGIDRTA